MIFFLILNHPVAPSVVRIFIRQRHLLEMADLYYNRWRFSFKNLLVWNFALINHKKIPKSDIQFPMQNLPTCHVNVKIKIHFGRRQAIRLMRKFLLINFYILCLVFYYQTNKPFCFPLFIGIFNLNRKFFPVVALPQ